jgi:3-hydroxyisobutyrate dehydrogenase-like beta-hydroxyacid dehydrogenase
MAWPAAISMQAFDHARDLGRQLGWRRTSYIDCPVTGLPDAAASGKLMLLADAPLLGRAAVEAYARATAEMPDDDEGRMIEIVSRPR